MNIHKRSGFTLLEIIIVVIIIAVLASIMAPQFNSMIVTARNNAALNSAKIACTNLAANATLSQAAPASSTAHTPLPNGCTALNSVVVGQVITTTATCAAPMTNQTYTCSWAN